MDEPESEALDRFSERWVLSATMNEDDEEVSLWIRQGINPDARNTWEEVETDYGPMSGVPGPPPPLPPPPPEEPTE